MIQDEQSVLRAMVELKGRPNDLDVDALDVWFIISSLQLAVSHPDLSDGMKETLGSVDI